MEIWQLAKTSVWCSQYQPSLGRTFLITLLDCSLCRRHVNSYIFRWILSLTTSGVFHIFNHTSHNLSVLTKPPTWHGAVCSPLPAKYFNLCSLNAWLACVYLKEYSDIWMVASIIAINQLHVESKVIIFIKLMTSTAAGGNVGVLAQSIATLSLTSRTPKRWRRCLTTSSSSLPTFLASCHIHIHFL